MNQRGSIGIYLVFSILVSIAAGFGVYRWIRDHKPAKDDDAATTTTTKPKKIPESSVVTAPVPEPAVAVPPEEAPTAVDPMSSAMAIAQANAEDPSDSDEAESPVFGTPGISGSIERGAVERRFKPRAAILQRCFQRSGGEPGKLRVTMRVEPDGKISQLTLSAGWDDGFVACVTSALNFTFSATKDGNPAAVVQPIAFR